MQRPQQKCSIKRKEWNRPFECNHCRKLLRHIAYLRQLLRQEAARAASDASSTEHDALAMEEAVACVDALESFGRVVTACFGKNLEAGWRLCIRNVETKYSKTCASVTPKAHIVFDTLRSFVTARVSDLGITANKHSNLYTKIGRKIGSF